MKVIERKIGEFFLEKIIKPIRSKQDVILLLLETLKLVKDVENGITNERGRIIICIDKMNRIFYETDEKIFSLCFPFSLEEKENHYLRIYDNLTDLEITNQMISLLISILKTINEQLSKNAQSYPTNSKTSSSVAPFLMN